MNVSHEREVVKSLYSGRRWAKRVANMSDAQVLAIYIKHMRKIKGETK